ncbi:MAG TPA: aminotransferase class III-fold pyridoxal phosphate-dependent enzyme, partial [Chloroflexota bacterium]|nr:aminotransferase class III-fold pyridoxal phosphate-dependent enzyme [Chloroflexota bacterium]
FFAGVRQLCDQYGAVMIVDEVQTGLGRCGEIWGIDLYGVVPDIIVSGKGLSGGLYPMSATLYRDHLNPFMHENPFIHISTCGGAELGCAVTLQVLDILTEPDFLPHVRQMAELFAGGFAELQHKHAAIIHEVRQKGMMMGLKLANPMLGPIMTVAGVEAGLLIIYANNDTSVIQILPPLIIEAAQVGEVLQRLDGAFTAVTAMLR